MQPLLEIKDLVIQFQHHDEISTAVNKISFNVDKGKITALVGESGSGKSLTALSLLQLLPQEAKVSGNIFLNDNTHTIDLNVINTKEITSIRGNKIAMIFQEPMTSLNPLIKCGNQVAEALLKHKKISKTQAREKTIQLFKEVELPDPELIYNRYPHQISGGQKQRVMIAMAISCNPSLLVADEPTTALDVRVQKSIMNLLKKLQIQYQMSVLLITHDLGLVADVADEIVVLYKGDIVEKGIAKKIIAHPENNYTKALLSCRPNSNSKGNKLPMLSDFIPSEKIIINDLKTHGELMSNVNNKKPVISIQSLKIYFPSTLNFWGKPTSFHKAVDDISFDVFKQETVGLVGESGCGKTTLGRAILKLIKPTEGKILVNGLDINQKEKRNTGKELQIVFQDPFGSLNPRLTIGDAITEPMKVHHLFRNQKERKENAIELMKQVSLNSDYYNRYPHQFSGGQRQRICIARALSTEPSIMVFDESVSALDVSVQAQVLNLINELKSTYKFTSLFISHDLSVVHYISDRIIVMKDGKIVEQGDANEIFFNPKDEYTRELIGSMPGKLPPSEG
ncbi:MAG: ABC transporter ATP-binding protein [Bacteroidota bacterium]